MGIRTKGNGNLGHMLGTNRSTVSSTAAELQAELLQRQDHDYRPRGLEQDRARVVKDHLDNYLEVQQN